MAYDSKQVICGSNNTPSFGEATSKPRERWFVPATDVFEREGSFCLVMDLPGVEEKNVNIDIEKGILTVTGWITQEEFDRHERIYSEFGGGNWRRSFSLPEEINLDKVEASLKDGVLRLELPKSARVLPRKISIKPA